MSMHLPPVGSAKWQNYEFTPDQKAVCESATKTAQLILATRPLGEEPILLSPKEYPNLPRSVIWSPQSKKTYVLLTKCKTQVDPLLGKGGFKKIKYAVGPKGQKFVVAITRKTDEEKAWNQLIQEKASLEKLRGVDGVVQLEAALLTEKKGYLILEYCPGGDLFDYASDRDRYNISSQAKREFCRKLLQALVNIHQKGIVHGDLRLENVLVMTEEEWSCKVGDFGLSASAEKQLVIGGDRYMWSPEKIENENGTLSKDVLKKSDVWCLGVVFYTFFVCSDTPWCISTLKEERSKNSGQKIMPSDVLKKIKDAKTFPLLDEILKRARVPIKLREFVLKLLDPDPNTRPSAEEALKLLEV